ncbi:MAG: NCS1 family nucleobase:cation symporter-1 [Mycobacteriales bacterium]
MTLTEPAPDGAIAVIDAGDGRITLPKDDPTLRDSRYSNDDLAPTAIEERRWNTYNYTALWVGMSHCIPSYLLASGLVALGLNWLQAIICIAAANVIVLIPMLLNGHAGTKYGIPFPVFARSSFGVRGANFAAILRALVACAWFGIQTWIGGEGIYILLGKLTGDTWKNAHVVLGYPWTQWVCFLAFWAVEMLIIMRGMDTLRRFENWAAPFVLIGAIALLIWITVKAGGFGPLIHEKPKLGWGPHFWKVFFPGLMGMIGFWSTLSLNIPDFTRFGGSQRQQMWGQALGLPTTMTFFALVAVLITSGTQVVYGTAIWDPIQLSAKLSNTGAIIFALVTVVVATVATNVAANTVSPSYDFSNLAPRFVSFRVGGLITGVLAIVMQPWRLLSNPHVYIFTWLGFYGGLLGAVAGLLIADYWLVHRSRLVLADLYLENGRYWYSGGWNPAGIIACVVGMVLAVGGAYSTPGNGPFPSGGVISFLKPLYDYSWLVGFAAAVLVYLALYPVLAKRRAGTARLTTDAQPA